MSDGPSEDVAKGVGGIVKPVYEDLLQPMVRVAGQELKTLAEVVDVCFAPVRGIVFAGRRAEEWMVAELTKRLRDVPPDQIVTPPRRIAGPALDGLRFVVDDDPVLADLYAGLLARAMQRELQGEAHPAFVECIKQMAPDEALLLTLFVPGDRRVVPIIRVQAKNREKGYRVLFVRHFSALAYDMGLIKPHFIPEYFDNLERLGLCDITYAESAAAVGAYDAIEAHEVFLRWKSKIEETHDFTIERGAAQLTDFGTLFMKVCRK
jgi:hypothetical protein